MKKLFCYNQLEFNDLCKNNNWTDENSLPKNSCFISIHDTDEVVEHNQEMRISPMFKESSEHILNLTFDDVSVDTQLDKLRVAKSITDEQLNQLLNFIITHKDHDFYIHCTAGRSRSQGVVRFMLDMFPHKYITRLDNPCITPNYEITRKLKRLYYNYEI